MSGVEYSKPYTGFWDWQVRERDLDFEDVTPPLVAPPFYCRPSSAGHRIVQTIKSILLFQLMTCLFHMSVANSVGAPKNVEGALGLHLGGDCQPTLHILGNDWTRCLCFWVGISLEYCPKGWGFRFFFTDPVV